jgi:hypothetical protein
MLIGIIIGITILYIAAIVYLYLTSEMPDLMDVEEIRYQ